MTKLVSIATSLLILFQSFNIHINDLVELDELIEHAQFHAEEYGDDFLVFLSKHYGELKAEHNQKHQEEQKEHEKLPFQQHCHSLSLSAFVINNLAFYTSHVEIATRNTGNFFYTNFYSPVLGDGLFQPPRYA
jgi:hypothetical protein